MSDFPPGLRRPERSADIVVGLGARAEATASEVLALVDSALAEHHLDRNQVVACVTLDRKCSHPALIEAAEVLRVPLRGVEGTRLSRVVPSPSATVFARIGLASVAEAAALTFGPLVAEKRRSANATCALSRQSSIASSAASTLSTSRAGP